MQNVSYRIAVAVLVALCALGGSGALAAQGRGPSSIELTPRYETDAARAGARYRMAVDVQLDEGYHVNSEAPLDPFLIPTELHVAPPPGIALEALAYPESILFDQVGDIQLVVFEERFRIGLAVSVAEDVAAGEYVLPARLKYQSCDETTCYAPTQADFEFRVEVAPATTTLAQPRDELFAGLVFDDEPLVLEVEPGEVEGAAPDVDPDIDIVARLDDFEVLATAGGYMGTDDFLGFIDDAESGEGNVGFFDDRGPLAILLLTLVGGLALNLTPCVLPMIPINLAIIGAGSQAGSRARGFALGSAYGLAMAVVYGGIGLAVILTAGTFGTINASPWFNLGIAVLFVILALAMFDKLVIDFSSLQSKLRFAEGGRGSFLVAFGMGAVAALLAGACVAPVVIQVIVFSSNLYATGTTQALALPFVLGLGMAIPWPIAGAGIASLPKPGPWMNKVKYVFGAFILATAAYYGYLSYELFAQYWVDPDEVAGSVEELLEEGWYASLPVGLAEAERDDKLILVDMWATWCKNCLVMDQTTLQDPGVEAALEDYVKVKLQTEDLSASPTDEIVERFGVVGLPAYAILRPKQ
jgi:thiol:disulfide interchange protein